MLHQYHVTICALAQEDRMTFNALADSDRESYSIKTGKAYITNLVTVLFYILQKTCL
jgi:hypothetical protein